MARFFSSASSILKSTPVRSELKVAPELRETKLNHKACSTYEQSSRKSSISSTISGDLSLARMWVGRSRTYVGETEEFAGVSTY